MLVRAAGTGGIQLSKKRKRHVEKKRRHRRATRVAGVAAATAVASASTAAVADAGQFTVANTNDSGPGSLRRAISSSNSTNSDDRIVFESGLSGRITLESELPPITSNVEVVGPGRKKLSIDGDDRHRILTATASATISGLTLENGAWDSGFPDSGRYECSYGYRGGGGYCPPFYGENGGGALLLKGDDADVHLDHVAITGNAGSGRGAVYVGGDTSLKIEDSAFSGNHKGGVAAPDYSRATIEVRNSSFEDNPGTALRTNGAHATVSGSTFIGNRGGAIVGYPRTDYPSGTAEEPGVVIANSRFRDNSRLGPGGAVMVHGGVRITGSSFFDNQSFGDSGGALSLAAGWNSASEVVNSTISGNIAESGGGIQVVAPFGNASGSMSLENLTITRNLAAYGPGGGVNAEGFVTADSLTVTGNWAKPPASSGGGGWNQASSTSTITNSIISGNTSTDGEGNDLGDRGQATGYSYYEETPGNLYLDSSLIGDVGTVLIRNEMPGSNIVGKSPRLRTLAWNGGPTRTRLPKPSSPVIDRGATDLTADQRGVERPIDFPPTPDFYGDDASDIGAVELRNPAFTFGKVKLNRRTGSARVFVKVGGPGRLILAKSRSVRKSKRKATHRSRLGLRVRARGEAARELRKDGRTTVRAKVTFRSRDGGVSTRSRKLELRLK